MVVALPAHAAAALVLRRWQHRPRTSSEVSRYTTSVNINLGLRAPRRASRPSWSRAALGASRSVRAVVARSTTRRPVAYLRARAWPACYTMSDWAEKLMERDDQTARRTRSSRPVSEVGPGLPSMIEFSHVNRWYPVIVYRNRGLPAPDRTQGAARPRIPYQAGGRLFFLLNLNTATAAGGERAAREPGLRCLRSFITTVLE